MTARPSTALVLSGGGARGAYEAGVLHGIAHILGRPHGVPVIFDLIAGTSVGAINATYLASKAHRGDLGVDELIAMWTGLSVRKHIRPRLRVLRGRSLLKVEPFEGIVQRGVDWPALRTNISSGVLRGLFLAALHIDSGRTTIFADVSPETDFVPSADPRRVAVRDRITTDHVLASAAIPGVFPPRRVGDGMFYDGGLRFNTPMSPVLRAGAERIVVVSPLHASEAVTTGPPVSHEEVGALFLAGKMLHAILLDPFAYDLQVLERFNDLLDVVDHTLSTRQRTRFDNAVADLRGVPYRRLDTLVISPSEDIGHMALDFVTSHRRRLLREGPVGIALAAVVGRLADSGTDLLSYLLFDGRFTARLVALGQRDAVARADEIRSFFGLDEAMQNAG